ncbi:MAG: DHH family phosphoesterase [Bacilli bacterium]
MMNKIIEKIQQYNTIIVHRHVRPDPDAYGSQGGLATAIIEAFPEKNVYVVGNSDPTLAYLNTMDEISDDVYEDALVIVCDTANKERIDDQRYAKGEFLIKIDHHPNNDPYGDIVWVDVNASSCSEMIYEFITNHSNGALQLSTKSSTFLYAGIVGDTGRFQFPNTRPSTFDAARALIKYDFSPVDIYNEMYKINENTARLMGYVYQSFKIHEHGVGEIRLTQEVLKRYNVNPNETANITGVLGHVEGIKVWAVFIEEAQDSIRVRFRSKKIVINDIAQRFGGGGHPLSSGGSIESWAVAENVIAALQEKVLLS